MPPWEHFGYDMVGVGGWFDLMPLRDYEELIEETDEWEVKRNGAGAALKYWKHKSGTPEHIDFRMTTREIWERDYRPHLLDWDPERFGNLDETRKNMADARAAQNWIHYGHMFIWETMRQSMGDVTLYESLLLDPAWVHDYNRVYTDFYKRYFAYLFEQVGLPDGIWLYEDLGYKNGLFASPKVLRELIFPYYKEMVDFFHGYDLPVVLHTCGSTAQALPLIVGGRLRRAEPHGAQGQGQRPLPVRREVRRPAGLRRRAGRAHLRDQRPGHHPARGHGLHRGHEGPRRAAGVRLGPLDPAHGELRHLPVRRRRVPGTDDVLSRPDRPCK